MKMTSSKGNLSKINEINNSINNLAEDNENSEKKIYTKNDLEKKLNEMKNVIKDKENTLRDKDRDLSLAAEIGQHLLEANTVLKKAYEELFIQNQEAQNKLHRYEQLNEQLTTIHSGRSSPVQSSAMPLSPRFAAMRSRNNSPTPPRSRRNSSRRGSRNLSLPPSVRLDGTGNSSPSSGIARINDSSESDIDDISNSLKEQYLEKIRYLENSINTLERKNEELKTSLEKKDEEVKDIQIQNNKIMLDKDTEVSDLKQELETLMIKAKKLEMEKKSLTKENQRQANELDRIESVDQEYIQDLLVKINRLEGSLKKTETAKEELEKNIENAMEEKLEYQNKCKTLDKKLQDYHYYKVVHDSQAQHIQELNQIVEQQRMKIQNMDFQIYNLSMSSVGNTTSNDIKSNQEKYRLANYLGGSSMDIQKSNMSLQSKSSLSNINGNSSMSNNNTIESMYDSDTLVITAKRNIHGSSNNILNSNASLQTNSNFNLLNSTMSINNGNVPNSDPDLTLSTTNLGKRNLYSELESTDWYNKMEKKYQSQAQSQNLIQSQSFDNNNNNNNNNNSNNNNNNNNSNDSRFIRSSSEGLLSERNKLLNSGPRQPYHHQYHSSYALIGRKQSSSSNDEALSLIDKANQSFGNNSIEKIIKPQILKNDVNSYEVLINSIENEFKNSEEIQKNDDHENDNENENENGNDNDNNNNESNIKKGKNNIGKEESKIEIVQDLDLSISSIEKNDSSKISFISDKNDISIDDTNTNDNNQSSRSMNTTSTINNTSIMDNNNNNNNNDNNNNINNNNDNNNNNNNNNSTGTSSFSRSKYSYSSLTSPKTLALIKHSNIPLFDYKKLSHMIENDKTLNPPKINTTNNKEQNSKGMRRSVSDDISQRSPRTQNILFQEYVRHISYESLFRAFEISKFQSTHLITDSNYSSNSKNGKKNNNNNNNNNNTSQKSSFFNLSNNYNSSNNSSISIQEITDDEIETSKENNNKHKKRHHSHKHHHKRSYSDNHNNNDIDNESDHDINNENNNNNNNNNTENNNNTKNSINNSILSNTMIPMNSTSNKEFNSLIKNFHLASPITPLIANINLNNAIKEEASHHTQSNDTNSNSDNNNNNNDNNNNNTLSSSSTSSLSLSKTTKSKHKSKTKSKSMTNGDKPKTIISLKNKPLFGTTNTFINQKMDLSLIYKEAKEKDDTLSLSSSSSSINNPGILSKEPIDPSNSSVTFKNLNRSHENSSSSSSYFGLNENPISNGNYTGTSNDLFRYLKEKQNQVSGNGNGNSNNTSSGNLEDMNSIFNSSSSILSSNVIMNNQVMLDQYRNTLNHYSNSGSAILQVLIDSWLRFLNGFVGYGSNINYDINNMDYNGSSMSSLNTNHSNSYSNINTNTNTNTSTNTSTNSNSNSNTNSNSNLNSNYPYYGRYSHERSKSSFSEDSFSTSTSTSDVNTPASGNPSTNISSSVSSTQNIKALAQTMKTKKI